MTDNTEIIIAEEIKDTGHKSDVIILPSQTPDRFNITKATIQQLKISCENLKINGVGDKAGYLAVEKARKDAKSRRGEIKKTKEALNDLAKKYIETNNSDAAVYIQLLEDIEELCEKKTKIIDDEVERIKQEQEKSRIAQEQAMADRRMRRVSALQQAGCSYDGNMFKVGKFAIGDAYVKTMNDVEFATTFSKVEEEQKIVLAAQAEAIRFKKEEDDRIAEEQRKESERLEKIRLDLENEKKKAKEAQDKIDAENKRVSEEQRKAEENIAAQKRELLKKQTTARVDKLQSLGMRNQYGSFWYNDFSIKQNTIELSDEEAWGKIILNATDIITSSKVKEAEKKQREIDDAKEAARLQGIAEENERQRKQKEDEENKKKEEIRLAALAPDKEKLLVFSEFMNKVEIPSVNTESAKKVTDDIRVMIGRMTAYILTKVKSL